MKNRIIRKFGTREMEISSLDDGDFSVTSSNVFFKI
jgi:hypothetical protein